MGREQLQQQDSVEKLFEQFGACCQGKKHLAKNGQIVSATLIPVPEQGNGQRKHQTIQQGKVLSKIRKIKAQFPFTKYVF